MGRDFNEYEVFHASTPSAVCVWVVAFVHKGLSALFTDSKQADPACLFSHVAAICGFICTRWGTSSLLQEGFCPCPPPASYHPLSLGQSDQAHIFHQLDSRVTVQCNRRTYLSSPDCNASHRCTDDRCNYDRGSSLPCPSPFPNHLRKGITQSKRSASSTFFPLPLLGPMYNLLVIILFTLLSTRPQASPASFGFSGFSRIGEAKNPGPVDDKRKLIIGSLNVTSLKKRAEDLHSLCGPADILFLQETSVTQNSVAAVSAVVKDGST